MVDERAWKPPAISVAPLGLSTDRRVAMQLLETADDLQLTPEEAEAAFADPRYARLQGTVCRTTPGQRCATPAQFYASILDYLSQRRDVRAFLRVAERELAAAEKAFVAVEAQYQRTPDGEKSLAHQMLRRVWRHYRERVEIVAAYRPDVVAASLVRLFTDPTMRALTTQLRDLFIATQVPLTAAQWCRVAGGLSDGYRMVDRYLLPQIAERHVPLTTEVMERLTGLFVAREIDQDTFVRHLAAGLHLPTPTAEGVAMHLLHSEDRALRLAALRLMGTLWIPAAAEAAVSLLDAQDKIVQIAAVQALARYPSANVVEALLARQNDPDVKIRLALARTLRRGDDEQVKNAVQEALVAMFADSSPEVRRAAMMSIGQMGGERARRALQEIIYCDPQTGDADLVQAAKEAYFMMVQRDEWDN